MMSMLERKGGTAIAPMTLTGLLSGPGGTRGARPRLEGAICADTPVSRDHQGALITNVRDTANATTSPFFDADGIVRLPLVTQCPPESLRLRTPGIQGNKRSSRRFLRCMHESSDELRE